MLVNPNVVFIRWLQVNVITPLACRVALATPANHAVSVASYSFPMLLGILLLIVALLFAPQCSVVVQSGCSRCNPMTAPVVLSSCCPRSLGWNPGHWQMD